MTSAELVGQLITALEGDAEIRAAAQSRLIEIGQAAVEPLIAVVETQEGRKAWIAAEVLGELADRRAWPVLVAALRSRNAMLAVAAAKALLKYPGEDTLPPFVEALPDAHIMAQQAIILTLQRLGDRRAVAMLVAQLERAASPTIRTALIQTLGKLGDPSAIPAIRAYLEDENHHVREWSVEVLRQLGDTTLH